ncbi:MAG: heavy metal-binding domain-containing protein [Armatimonadetes bacterium]|nr:heavy metal-binding domain-containing protein [Armatimonadota bacterium]
MPINTGFNGNEIYCLHKKGYSPGELVIGNSVWSVGFLGGIGSALKTIAGGEVTQITDIIHQGRKSALNRMEAWTGLHGAVGITGVTNELVIHSGNIEFLSVGSAVHRDGYDATALEFTSSADGQELFCQLDAGFTPMSFAFGNVAYSVGLGGGIMGSLRSLARGEIKEFSNVFYHTRHLALERIQREAVQKGANCVVGIKTSILKFGGMQEMVMLGTASRHPAYGPEYDMKPATSDMTCEEMWNMIHVGYVPLELVIGVSVYSIGFAGGLSAFVKSFARGEISELTELVYHARERALSRLMENAVHCGADDVVGIKTYVYSLGSGIIEFLAIGTAVKKVEGLKTHSEQLPPQAVMQDKDTFLNVADTVVGTNLNEGNKIGRR